ncbi:MAG: ASKHA domain-containing protein [Candidatus Izemoplasmatales bacterium]|nr:ASKHA domain-containing protein [Candidatus Izemoplasmatales bacterium]MDY0138154.1 ASKHA domain-containing protein [Candidatus Izemoplasmatales bacterium]
MNRITVHVSDEIKVISAKTNDNLLQVLRDNKIYISSPCGGRGICNKCLIRLIDENRFEKACQITITKDMDIEIISNQGEGLHNFIVKKSNIKSKNGFGVCVDIGTTTIAIYLVDNNQGYVIMSKSCLNPQSSYGADVISRIDACSQGRLEELSLMVIDVINEAIHEFIDKFSIDKITEAYIAANPVMLHIVAKKSPVTIGYAPYTPLFLNLIHIPGISLGIKAENVTLMPSISSFIGSDITMGIISSNIMNDFCSILIDFGTNGEMVLKHNQKYFAISTATGPAFEGASITMGMGGVTGAINRVQLINEEICLSTVYGEPKGISGSGLIDIVAILLNVGLIDEYGGFNHESRHFLRKYLIEDKFYLTPYIYISQADIRQFQLAKSAIKSGILTLISYAQLEVEQIEKVYIAGGFGFYLDYENAVTSDLIPNDFLSKIIPLGNASGQGLIDCMLEENKIKIASEIVKDVKVIELTNNKIFSDYFIENMIFEKDDVNEY